MRLSLLCLLVFSFIAVSGCSWKKNGTGTIISDSKSNSKVTLWQDVNHSGDQLTLKPGDFYADLRDWSGCDGDWEDCASSISVSPGCTVHVWTDISRRGHKMTFTSSDRNAQDWFSPHFNNMKNGGNDRVSSIEVEPGC
ncbi:MAG: hypothetical protein HQM13_23980 [SAR324 cluster bacterium]|nr:hypothetical protein [SAR324 cluster bacterium]